MSTERRVHRRERAPLRPFLELEDMYRRFEDNIARPFLHSMWERIPEGVKAWAPSVDIFEKDDDLVVKVELPGLKYEDIDVSVSEDILVVKGEKEPDSGVKEENYYRSEIAYGNFYRSVPLPFSIDTKNIEAVYEGGVLYVTLKNALGAKSQKVEVRVKKGEA
jgi:HSP20 family protein